MSTHPICIYFTLTYSLLVGPSVCVSAQHQASNGTAENEKQSTTHHNSSYHKPPADEQLKCLDLDLNVTQPLALQAAEPVIPYSTSCILEHLGRGGRALTPPNKSAKVLLKGVPVTGTTWTEVTQTTLSSTILMCFCRDTDTAMLIVSFALRDAVLFLADICEAPLEGGLQLRPLWGMPRHRMR